jgi:peptidoglycan/xylan/chitin deacetylase (PgdA/CDA1 family)
MEPRWPVDAKVGANASLPRSTFLSSGGFDERLGSPWQRKVELGVRLWKMGVRFKYQPLAKACQIHVKSAREFVERDGRKQGRSEILFLRIHPDLRPYSPLARLGEGSPVKRLAREIIMRSPASPGLFLRVPLWAAGQLRSIPFARLAGIRLLQAGQEIEMSRCALKEVGSWRAYRAYLGLRLPVLMYHHVGPLQSRVFPGISVSSDLFERHIQWLVRRGYVGIRPADWLAWCREGKALPMKPVLLSFDDAYADIADYALPVLQRYGFGAAVFVTTSYVGKTNVWDEAKGWGTLRLMTAEQIRTWATQGIEFGAHTRTHPNLTKLSPAQLQEEVVGSRDDLAALLGTRVISFAYPYGRYNERVRKCVREIFDLAFVTHSGIPNLVTPPELLPRAIVYPEDSPIDLAFLTRWGRNPLHGFRWYTARVKRYVARRAKRILRPGRRTA